MHTDIAKAMYRRAIDPGASDRESDGWWSEVVDELRRVVEAQDDRAGAAVIAWWHHDWSTVSDTPLRAAKRIRRVAKLLANAA
jgi:hypothetical protein